MSERCRVCENVSEFFGRATVLGKYDVAYFRCRGCGYVQTEEPYWLSESYSEAITSTDVGLVERNDLFAKHTKYLIWVFLDNGRGRYLDRWSLRAGVWAIDHRHYLDDFQALYDMPLTALTDGSQSTGRRGPDDPSYSVLVRNIGTARA